ncbi:MAG: sugar-binding transcriptional regulator [Spirochaetia bacterium]
MNGISFTLPSLFLDFFSVTRHEFLVQYTDKSLQDAAKVAKLYYYSDLTTQQIAKELNVSRPTVSRLLSLAKKQGLVEIRVRDKQDQLLPMEELIKAQFQLDAVHIVSVPEVLDEVIWLERVAKYAARHLNTVLKAHSSVGVAWGTTMSAISEHLVPTNVYDLSIVQLNGSGNTFMYDNSYAATILKVFADAYNARVYLLPVPTFFDRKETKEAMWREKSVRRVLQLQHKADVLLYSIGAVSAGVPSHIHAGGYLEREDQEALKKDKVIGDIATVFFRADGSWSDIKINARASGPPLTLFEKARHGICVVSGLAKAAGLLAALRAGYMTELIVDAPTAHRVLQLASDGSRPGS